MSRRIYFDGLNLSLEHGTGIATYTRVLANVVHDLDYEVGVVYSSPQRPSKNPLLREIGFFDSREAAPVPYPREIWNAVSDQFWVPLGVEPSAVNLTGTVIIDQFQGRLPLHDHLFVARNLFANARRYFSWSGRFVDLVFDSAPDILHCTYQMPLRAKRSCNIYTIHDLVPLRLPFTTLDNKRQTYKLLRKIAAEADHIVTVSENSKRDIVQLLGVPEERVTNTYEAVEFPRELVDRSEDLVAAQLRSSYGLEMQDYLLFYGALEPKKNVARLIDAYMLSAVDIPLVITGPVGWGNKTEAKRLRGVAPGGPRPAERQPAHLPFRICQPADAGDLDQGCPRGDLPVALRGVRAAGAGSDAARHPGGDVAGLLAAGDRRRRGALREPLSDRRDRPGDQDNHRRRRSAGGTGAARPDPGRAVFGGAVSRAIGGAVRAARMSRKAEGAAR